MATERYFGEEITTTLTIVVTDSEGTETETDADDTPTAIIYYEREVHTQVAAEDVTHADTGVYTFTWTPDCVGTYVFKWSFTIGGDDYDSEETIDIIAVVEGTSDSSDEDSETTTTSTADIGNDNICTVTGTFYDASGNYMNGVFVRFTPSRSTDAFISQGVIALEATAESDENGALSLELIRGVKGMLTITGLGIVREVEIPDNGTIDIMDLVALGDDLLEVQKPQFVKLPRRS